MLKRTKQRRVYQTYCAANNALIEYLRARGVRNEHMLEADGLIDGQVARAIIELVERNKFENAEVAATVRDICKGLDLPAAQLRLTSPHWGPYYDHFIIFLACMAVWESLKAIERGRQWPPDIS